MKNDKDPSDFVKLAAVVGGIFLVIVVVVLIFAKEALVFVFTSGVWAFVVLGIVLGAFQYKAMQKK
jgi:hypothetical protein